MFFKCEKEGGKLSHLKIYDFLTFRWSHRPTEKVYFIFVFVNLWQKIENVNKSVFSGEILFHFD